MHNQISLNQAAFFKILKAGLWEHDVRLSSQEDLNFQEVNRLAEEQSVVGLVAAGLEHVTDVKVPQKWALQFAGEAIQLEQRNKAMNQFVSNLIVELRKKNIDALLVKGQGIAQCYERPLWRACGDVDLLLDKINYQNAIDFLSPLAHDIDNECGYNLHQALNINNWEVELHGTLRTSVSPKIDSYLDQIQNDTFSNREVRIWENNNTDVFLPSPNNDVIFIFCHILQHYFNGGIGLRQICDWCRLLWTYHWVIDYELLESRLHSMGIICEWKSFAFYAVSTLGMPGDAMPLYEESKRWKRKSKRINDYILKVGNLGHNNDFNCDYYKYPVFWRKMISMWKGVSFSLQHIRTFPSMSLTSLYWKMVIGITNTFKG